jgi:hypothetical protein
MPSICSMAFLLTPEADCCTLLHCGVSRRLLANAQVAGHASGLLLRPLAQKAPALMSVTKSVERQALLQLARSRPSSSSLHEAQSGIETLHLRHMECRPCLHGDHEEKDCNCGMQQ